MKHKHADLMLEYAKDAQETDKPWERWEYYCVGGVYLPLRGTPLWERGVAYRRIDPYRKFREAQERGEVVETVYNWRSSATGEVVFPDNPEWQLFDGDFDDHNFRRNLLPPEFFRIKPKAEDIVDEITSSLMNYLKERPEKLKEVAREFGLLPPEKPKTKKLYMWAVNSNGSWSVHDWLCETEEDVQRAYDKKCVNEFKRLDYTAIEVEA